MRRIATFVLSLVLLAFGSVAMAGSVSADPSLCSSALFIGVRGSGEKAADAGGYGKEIAAVKNGYLAALPSGVSHTEVALDYPALAVNQIFKVGGASRYLDGVQVGINKLMDRLSYSQIHCTGPNTQQWILAGYSQGALVIDQAIRSFNDPSHNAQVILIADPHRTPRDVGVDYGTAKPGFGVWQLIESSPAPLATTNMNVQKLCDTSDPVCDWSHHQDLDYAANAGALIHTTYVERDAKVLRGMGSRAAGNLRFSAPPRILSVQASAQDAVATILVRATSPQPLTNSAINLHAVCWRVSDGVKSDTVLLGQVSTTLVSGNRLDGTYSTNIYFLDQFTIPDSRCTITYGDITAGGTTTSYGDPSASATSDPFNAHFLVNFNIS